MPRASACLFITVLTFASIVGLSRSQAQTPPMDTMASTILLRTSLVALNHANITGNYTVLRDLSAPSFAADYTAATLAAAFTTLRQEGLNLAPLTVIEPVFTQAPTIVDGGLLRLVGHFPSRPTQINFDLHFQPVNGQWRLSGLAVEPVLIPSDDASAAAPNAVTE